ncbi:hypothetical protein AX17_005128 [Amanita inopinata Kibby_2008]|nr:hypothetical protein AX17_005128 [Amanita inopinata Kibby_2008]
MIEQFILASHNVLKNTANVHTVLEHNTDIDILFMQEIPRYKIKSIASTKSKHGEDIFDIPTHPNWVTIYHNMEELQVAIFIRKSLFETFFVFIKPYVHYNILTIQLTTHTNETLTLTNIYNKPTDNIIKLIDTASDVIAGDFNTHHPAWDVCPPTPDGQHILDHMAAAHLQLLDNDYIPTWKRQGSRPSVIDLIFVKDRFDPNIWSFTLPSSDFVLSDHCLLKCSIPWHDKQEFKLCLKKGSDKELEFLCNILAAQWYREKDPETSASQLCNIITTQWHQHAMAVSNCNKTLWWNDDNADAYNSLLESRLSGNHNDTKVASNNFKRMSLEELWDTLHSQYCKTTGGDTDDSIIQDIPSKQEHVLFAISKMEICDALALCSNVSTPGPDHLTWYHLKHLINDEEFLQNITCLYNDILDEGIWPSVFKESFSIIIPKPNKPVKAINLEEN